MLHRLFITGMAVATTACDLHLLLTPEPCDKDAIVQAAAGPNAVNCGVTGFGGDAGPVHFCTVAAFAAGKPFLGRMDLVGIDTTGFEYRMMDPDGGVFFYQGENGDETGQGVITMFKLRCHDPFITTDGPTRVLACDRINDSRRICSNKDPPTP